MLLKRIAILTAAGAALGAAVPAFADHSHWAPDQGYRSRHYAPRAVAVYPHRYAVATPRPVAAYRAPVYYGPQPMPAYGGYRNYGRPPMSDYRGYRQYDYAASGTLAGAVAGALIGGSVAYGDQQGAGIAIGSILGAVIGHELVGGH